mgnify:CR=1 FL=1
MKTTFGLACALSLLTVMNTATAQSGDYLAALVATRSSDAASATSYLANALEKDPDERALIRQQMQILTIEGDFDAALPYAQDFLAIDPQDALAQTIVRIGAIRRDDWPTGLAALPLAAESRLDAIIEASTYASVLTGNGQADQALIKVEAGLDAIGFSSLGHYARGLVYAVQGQYEDSADAVAAFAAEVGASVQRAISSGHTVDNLALESQNRITQVARTPPPTLGSPHILGQLGAGAMGEVLIAKDPGLNRIVAIKRIHAEAAQNRTMMRRFYTEAQVNAQLDHPNIVPIHGLNVNQSHGIYVMDG